MDERWVALLAAVLGLLGGMGGAAVGGYVANQGQEQRFAHERATEARDRAVAAYVQFIRAVQAERFNAAKTDDQLISAAQAEVALVTTHRDVRDAAARLAGETLFSEPDEAQFQRLSDEFVTRAQREIEAIE